MKTQQTNLKKVLVSMVLCCALVAGSLFTPGAVTEAAGKAAISATKMTIPVGKTDSALYWNVNIYEVTNGQELTVKNAVEGATYEYVSSDTKVATINKDGGFLTGVKAGSATITCTQIYNDQKTKIGQCKVTVKNSGLEINEFEDQVYVGKGGYDLTHYYACLEPLFGVTYRNPEATYTLKSNSKNFSIKAVKYDASMIGDLTTNEEYQQVVKDYVGDRIIYGYQYTAKKAGTYKVTVKETYKNKTRTLGTVKVVVTK